MENISQGIIKFNRKAYLIVLGVVCLFLVALLGLLLFPLFSPQKTTPPIDSLPTPTPIPSSSYIKSRKELTPLQKTQPGKTSDAIIKQTLTVEETEKLPDGATKYFVPSVQPGVNDEIITQHGVVTSETTITQTSTLGPLPHIEDYEKLFGQPEAVTSGTKSFGKFADAHIYASKGVMFVVNRFTHEVYQIQRFTPLSLSEYKQTYAEYILPSTEDQAP
jgi:hypothetical protein